MNSLGFAWYNEPEVVSEVVWVDCSLWLSKDGSEMVLFSSVGVLSEGFTIEESLAKHFFCCSPNNSVNRYSIE